MDTPKSPIEYEIGSDDWDFEDEPCWLFTVTDYQLKPRRKRLHEKTSAHRPHPRG